MIEPNFSGRDINDGPVHAPDGTYACGDPDCYSCWPEGAPNTVGYSAGAVCFPVRHHAIRAICSGRRGTYGTSMLTRYQWWPGKEPNRPRPWRDPDWRYTP